MDVSVGSASGFSRGPKSAACLGMENAEQAAGLGVAQQLFLLGIRHDALTVALSQCVHACLVALAEAKGQEMGGPFLWEAVPAVAQDAGKDGDLVFAGRHSGLLHGRPSFRGDAIWCEV